MSASADEVMPGVIVSQQTAQSHGHAELALSQPRAAPQHAQQRTEISEG